MINSIHALTRLHVVMTVFKSTIFILKCFYGVCLVGAKRKVYFV